MSDIRSGNAPLILASASPRRRELLASLGVAFDVVVAKVEEHEHPDTDPRVMVAHNSALKADWVALRYPAAWVLGADTTVFVDGKALNKPVDLTDARRMLRQLSGRAHTVFTGLAVRQASTGFAKDLGVASQVKFRRLSEEDITNYLSSVNVLDKAGAYAVQEHGELIIEGIEGSYTNIVGLPLEETKQILCELGLV